MNRDFKGVWIPKEIWLAKGFSLHEKVLWAEIHSLFDREKGGCFAQNEYLMEFIGLKPTRFHEVLSNLKKKGWVVQISFNGRQRVLKACVPSEDFSPEKESGGQRSGKADLFGSGKRTASVRESGIPPYIERKDYKKEEREGAKAPKPPARTTSSKAIEKYGRATHVETTNEEHEELLRKHGPTKLEALYKILSEWKDDKPRSKWRKNDARCIEDWVIDKFRENELKIKKREKAGNEEDNITYAKKIADNFNLHVAPTKKVKLEAFSDRIEIYSLHATSTRQSTVIRYSSNGFKDQLENALSKWGLR